MIYVYTFVQLPNQPLQLPPGINSQLEIVQVGAIAAVAEPDLPLETLQASDERLLQAVMRHDHIIQSVFHQTPVLPLRFGTCFPSIAALQAHLTENCDRYTQQLTALANKAEYTIELTPPDLPKAAIAPDLKGKEYFLAKRRLYEQQSQAQAKLLQQQRDLIELLAQLGKLRPISAPEASVCKVCLLVEAAPNRLQTAIARLQQHYADWQIRCSDPLPPYHFLEDV